MAMPEIYGLYCEWNLVLLLVIPLQIVPRIGAQESGNGTLPFHVLRSVPQREKRLGIHYRRYEDAVGCRRPLLLVSTA